MKKVIQTILIFGRFKLQRSMNLEVDNGQLCDKALMYSQILKVSLHFTASRVPYIYYQTHVHEYSKILEVLAFYMMCSEKFSNKYNYKTMYIIVGKLKFPHLSSGIFI